jgi:hypothetical protein
MLGEKPPSTVQNSKTGFFGRFAKKTPQKGVKDMPKALTEQPDFKCTKRFETQLITHASLLNPDSAIDYFSFRVSLEKENLWIHSILPCISSRSKSVTFEIENGIPAIIRGSAWPQLLGNFLQLSPFTFESLKRDSLTVDQLIDKDIPRTFPDLNPLFDQIHSLSDSLREILIVFSCMRPDVGYTQGMAHVAGMFLLHCGSASDCFGLFSNFIIKHHTLYMFQTFNLDYI